MKSLGLRDCDTCDKPFVADEEWKRVCVLCWKESKGYKPGIGDRAFGDLQKVVIELQVAEQELGKSLHEANLEAEELQTKLKAARRKARQLRKELREKEQQQPEPVHSPTPLSADQIKALLRLCHPDKHGNSELATRTTQWLLSMRKKP